MSKTIWTACTRNYERVACFRNYFDALEFAATFGGLVTWTKV